MPTAASTQEGPRSPTCAPKRSLNEPRYQQQQSHHPFLHTQSASQPNLFVDTMLGIDSGHNSPTLLSPRNREQRNSAGSFSSASMSSAASIESHNYATLEMSSTDHQDFSHPIETTQSKEGPAKKIMVRARVTYESPLAGHLNFQEGQIIEVLQQDEDAQTEDGHALWRGRAIIGGREQVGVFPSVYVALMKSRLNRMGSCDFNTFTKTPGHLSKKELRQLNKDCISQENLELEMNCGKLFRALEELVDTEMRHVADLSVVLEVFIRPFQDSFGPVLTRQVFSDWVPLLRVHEQVLYNLLNALPTLKTLAERLESVGNDPSVQRALRDGIVTTTGPKRLAKGLAAPSSFAAFAEGVNQAAKLGVGPISRDVSSKPLGSIGTTPGAITVASSSTHASRRVSQPRDGDLISEAELASIKARLDFLSDLHREHLSDFLFMDDAQIRRWKEILRETTLKVCQVMTEMSDWLKLCIPCVVNQPTAMKALLRSKATATAVAPLGHGASVSPKMFIQLQAAQECEKLKHLDLASFLIKPMQRITKYPLLMREICKYNKMDPDTFAVASEAVETMTRIATNVNTIIKQHQGLDQSRKVNEICSQLRPRETVDRLGLGTDSRGRRLHRYGKVTFQTLTTNVSSAQLTSEGNGQAPAAQLSKTEEIRHGSCYALAFASVLLLSLRSWNKWKTKTKFHIVKVIETRNIVSVESVEGCLAVRTACSVLLITPLEGDVVEWLVDLQECRRIDAADRERQDVVKAQRQKRQETTGEMTRRRTQSADLTPKPTKTITPSASPHMQQVPRIPAKEPKSAFVLSKEDRDGILRELKGHARFSTVS